jgi:hypothetical protein
MTKEQRHELVIDMIFDALKEAEKKHPGWPKDPIHAAGIMAEECGETMQACIDACYSQPSMIHKAAREAAQTGAMAVRFLIGVPNYDCKPGEQS